MKANTKLYPALRTAAKQFAELVKHEPEVRCVVITSPSADVLTYVERLDEDLTVRIFRAEDRIHNQHPDLELDFHTIYLEGRKLEHFIGSDAEVIYTRSSDGE